MDVSVTGSVPVETSWRLFVAITLPEDLRAVLGRLQERWKRSRADVRWVRPSHFHLTLAFLGDVPTDRVPAIVEAIESVAAGAEPFEMRVHGWGYFGRDARPRVLWTGVDASPALCALHERMLTSLSALGFQFEERPAVFHITLGRVRSSKGLDALTLAMASTKNDDVTWGIVRVDRLDLMRSELRPQGPVYTVVHSAELGSSDHGEEREKWRG